MKDAIVLLLFGIIGLASNSQAQVTLYGNITNPKGDKVYVKYYKDYLSYNEAVVDSANLDNYGNFSMTFDWEKYYPATFYHGDEITEMFLSPKDELKLTLDTKMFDETVKYEGTGSIVNNYLAQKTLLFPGMDGLLFKSPELEFTHTVDSLHLEELRFFNDYFSKVPNQALEKFIAKEKADIYYMWLSQKSMYPSYNKYLNRAKPTEISPNYYQFLDGVDPYASPVMASSAYQNFLSDHVESEIENILSGDTSLNVITVKSRFIAENLTDELSEFVLAKWIYDLMTEDNDLKMAKALFENFALQFPESQYNDLLLRTISITSSLQPGNEAPGFRLADVDGKMVSLNSFRGKIVYLDIWATWCGPCRTEIPHAQKLQEEMSGQDVVFLFVSVDDEEKVWKDLIKEKEMKGVHLISKGNFESQVAQLYNVKGIPQYIIIGKNGEILDINANRPSGNVKADLENYLK